MSSSESGFSELETADKTDDTDVEDSSPLESRDKSPTPVLDDIEEESESEEIPDPFSDDEDEIEQIPQHFLLPVMTSSVREESDEEDFEDALEPEAEKDNRQEFTPIFIPSMSYLAQVFSS